MAGVGGVRAQDVLELEPLGSACARQHGIGPGVQDLSPRVDTSGSFPETEGRQGR